MSYEENVIERSSAMRSSDGVVPAGAPSAKVAYVEI